MNLTPPRRSGVSGVIIKLIPGLLILFLFTLSTNISYPHDKVTTFAGEIYGTIYLENRVNIISDVTVKPGATLKIKPGSALVFLNPKAQLIVYGNIQALGDKGEPIYFESPLAASTWAGIRLENSQSKNIIKYCRFRRARVAVTVVDSDLFIWQCRFRENAVSLKARGGKTKLRVKDTSFINNGRNEPFFENISGAEVYLMNDFWQDKMFDKIKIQTYNEVIKFTISETDPTDWTAE